MEYQVRRYRIREGHMSDFVDAWLAGVVPLRRAAGFVIESAWTVGEHEFLWVLGYNGEDTFEEADSAYYASSARAALDDDPRQYIESVVEDPARRIV